MSVHVQTDTTLYCIESAAGIQLVIECNFSLAYPTLLSGNSGRPISRIIVGYFPLELLSVVSTRLTMVASLSH